jgi:hypothetical protein
MRPPIAAALGVAVVAAICAAIAMAQGGDATSATERATAPFHNLALAKQAGYGLLKDKNGVACIAMDDMPAMGAMGVHYAKPALVGDGAIDTSRPEALVYEPLAHGKLKLAAVEYVVLKADWLAHHSKAPALFGHTFNFTPAGNRFGLPAYYSLHAWIWKHNPSGEFAMWNPTVTCKGK